MMNISVIIPVYNAEKYIKKAVASVLQFQEVKEVLLIDDGSKDKSLEICSSLSQNHPEIKVLTHSNNQNRGVSASRNLGIENATQEFITFLDADDYWLPNRFDAERVIFKDPKVDGVFGAIGTEYISEIGKKEYLEKFKDDRLTTVNYDAEGTAVFRGLIEQDKGFGTFFSMIALTIRRTAVENPKIRLETSLKVGEDKVFITILSFEKYLKSGIINTPIAMRTAHENNTITKVKNYSSVFFRHQHLYSLKIYTYLKDKNIMPSTKRELKYKYIYSKIAAQSGLIKYINFIFYSLQYPVLLQTRYRYFALKNNT